MKLTLQKVLVGTILVAIVGFFCAMVIQTQMANAGYISNTQPTRAERFVKYSFFASSTPGSTPVLFATSTSATSTNIASWTDADGRVDNGYMVVAGAKKVNFFFSRAWGGGNAGSSQFFVEVSADGSNWVPYNKLISNVTNTNAQTLTRVASVTISAATSTSMVTMDEDAIYAVRCIVVEATDGSHTCEATAQY